MKCLENQLQYELIQAAKEIRLARNDNSTPHFLNGTATADWVKSFLSRYPHIRFRKPEKLSRASANISRSKIKNFYSILRNYFVKHDLLKAIQSPEF